LLLATRYRTRTPWHGINSDMLRLRLIIIAAVCLGLATTAAATPRGTYIPIDDGDAHILPIDELAPLPQSHGSHILYVNPCWGGEAFSPGYNDSRSNRSSIVRSTRSLPQYPYGEASFNEVLACVRQIMSPFNITVVGEDPGNTPHHEAVICGHPNDLGMQSGVGGVAPFTCGLIENSITYTFPEVYGGSRVRNMCETIAQEAAHAWGLDHQMMCEDPMTYLSGCGDKSYQNADAPCGENRNRACQCGGSTQNSFQHILSIFGASTPTPPKVTITEPLNNTAVNAGFIVRADFTDDDGISEASLYIDGSLSMTLNTPPFVFNAPGSMNDGSHEVEVVAKDLFGAEGGDSIYVIIGEPCGGDDDCDGSNVCVDGRCVPGPDAEGGLGQFCEGGADCVSGLCGQGASGDKLCTEACDVAAEACPSGFECRAAGDNGVCWPGNGGGGASGGCAIGASRNLPLGTLLLLGIGIIGLVAPRKRRPQ